jgi:hypothetical protein
MLEFFSAKFADKYGLRDALILSEICSAARVNNEGVTGVTSLELRKRFYYLSRDQIRKALVALMEAGMLTAVKNGGGFSRELRYVPVDKAMRRYLLDLTDPRMPVKPRTRRVEA